MSLVSSDLELFFDSIRMRSTDEYDPTIRSITKVLNRHYYESDSEDDHVLVAGSVGRGTAVSGTSDLDMLYILPPSLFSRFDSYEGNGQSALLQDVKNALLDRWPRSKVKGDGQAVVVDFTDRRFTVDLVPAFEQNDGSYKYPDSNDGGHWRKTDPVPEQRECKREMDRTDGNFTRICNSLRIWKDEQGFAFGGLLIDTLVFDFFEETDDYTVYDGERSYKMLEDAFAWLSKRNSSQSYWHALGSGQQVRDKGKGAFVQRSKKASAVLSKAENDDEKRSALELLFGRRFVKTAEEHSRTISSERRWGAVYGYEPKEEFIEEKFPVDIRSGVSIDCKVTQRGFRTTMLKELLRRHWPLLRERSLDFYIVDTDVEEPYDVYWKVRNRGEVAFRKHMVRGELLEDTGLKTRHESTSFAGPHYVECFLVKDGVCVARDRIDVPISVGR